MSLNDENYSSVPSYQDLDVGDVPQTDTNADDNKCKRVSGWIVVIVIAVLLIVVALVTFTGVLDSCTVETCGDGHIPNEQEEMQKFDLLPEYLDGTAEGIFPDGINGLRALCNDLSEPPYFFKEGREGSENKYVIYMPGGAGCWDTTTCDSRYDTRASDMYATNETSIRGRGITNSDDQVGLNPFKDWNMAWIQYCTSDGYVGRVDTDDPDNPTAGSESAASVGLNGWHFAGDSVTQAFFDTLLTNHNMREATEIIVTASSAGAEGLFQHMTRIGDLLAEHAPNAKVKFGYDNGWHVSGVDDTWEGNPCEGCEVENRQGMYDGWKPHLNADCDAAMDEEDKWTCFYTADVLYPHQKYKDFHMHMHQFDFMQFSGYGVLPGNWVDWTDAELEFCLYLGDMLVQAAVATDAETSFSMPACREHDDWDKAGWVEEYLEYEQDSGDYDYLLADNIWDFVTEDNVFRSYDSCQYPYCNPTCALLPYDTTEGCTFC
jgi:hypothetical protein